jgi:hypothetical protein
LAASYLRALLVVELPERLGELKLIVTVTAIVSPVLKAIAAGSPFFPSRVNMVKLPE